MSLIDMIKTLESSTYADEAGEEYHVTLLPPMSRADIADFERKTNTHLSNEFREALEYSRGFSGVINLVDMAGIELNSYKDIFSKRLTIANDGYGNYWIIDMHRSQYENANVFYISHDPAVVVFQCENMYAFIEELVFMAENPAENDIDKVHEELSENIWAHDEYAMSYDMCMQNGDNLLREFVKDLGEEYLFVDMRQPQIGHGFSWGKYSRIVRHRDYRIFACKKRVSILHRILQGLNKSQ